jgi:iron complex transport system substrate-binding protein
MSHLRPTVAAALLTTLVLSLPGASQAQDAMQPASGQECGLYRSPNFPDLTPVAAGDGTVEAQSEFGPVQLPAAPGAALGMYTTDVDMLIWLGYPLASSQPIRGDNGYQTFPCFFPPVQLAGVDTFGNFPEYNYERILLAEPDFILNGLGYDAEVNQRLPQIAPTYSVNAFDGGSWQDHFRDTAEALGRLDRYEAWLAIYQARLAEVREAIKHNADAIVAPLGYWEGKFNTSCYAGVECTVLRDLGLTIFPAAMDNNGDGIEIGPEDVGMLKDIDYVFTMAGLGEQGVADLRGQLADAARNPLWAQLDFVQHDHIVPFEMEMVYGSPSGQLAFLEVVADALSR